MNIEQAQALAMICHYAKEYLKDNKTMSQSVDIAQDIIKKELKALEIISQNFKLVGNCLQAKNRYADSGWVFVKELEDEEEHNAWKEVLL